MGKLELADIKLILQNTSSEIQVVQKEASRDHNYISNQKIEKLNKMFDESENALRELKNINVSLTPNIKASDIQILMDHILKARKNKDTLNPAALQAILSSLQSINLNLNEIRVDEKDHKRGVKVEKIDHEKL